MKKVVCLILAFVMLMSMSTIALAASTDTDYEEYQQLINDGILGDDITFEYWKQLKTQSENLERALTSSGQFKLVYDSLGGGPIYVVRKGDIFITSGTSSAGILGHAGIAISTLNILHIAGPNRNPETITFPSWQSTYTTKGWTKVYRHSSTSTAEAAANWASGTYLGSNAEYKITMDLTSTSETYCSKLVWQAYYYGPETPCANGPTWGVRLPYDLPTTIHNVRLRKTYEET